MHRVTERKKARLDRPSVTGGAAALKACGYPPICCANRLPPRPLRGASACAPAALTAATPPVSGTPFPMAGMKRKEVIMGIYRSIKTASDNNTSGVLEALVAGLELEFGCGAGEALARRFLEAEEADFYWDARLEERWIGAWESADDEDLELDRIAVCGRLEGTWFSAFMLVDGNGQVHGMTRCRAFSSLVQAREAMLDAR